MTCWGKGAYNITIKKKTEDEILPGIAKRNDQHTILINLLIALHCK